jgi:hypothetical protein
VQCCIGRGKCFEGWMQRLSQFFINAKKLWCGARLMSTGQLAQKGRFGVISGAMRKSSTIWGA